MRPIPDLEPTVLAPELSVFTTSLTGFRRRNWITDLSKWQNASAYDSGARVRPTRAMSWTKV